MTFISVRRCPAGSASAMSLFGRTVPTSGIAVLVLLGLAGPALVDAANAPGGDARVEKRLIETAQVVSAADGTQFRYTPAVSRSGAKSLADPWYGTPRRVTRAGEWEAIDDEHDFAYSTDRLIGSNDYLDPDVPYIEWRHASTGGGGESLRLTRGASLGDQSCGASAFGYVQFALGGSQLLCFQSGGMLESARGFPHVLPGVGTYTSEIGTTENVRTHTYSVRAGTIQKVLGDFQRTIPGRVLPQLLSVRLLDADGSPVTMPIGGSTRAFATTIEAPRNATGMYVTALGPTYPDADAVVQWAFKAGDKAGVYKIRITHPDAGTNEALFTVDVAASLPPEDSVENEENVGNEQERTRAEQGMAGRDCKNPNVVGDPISIATGNVYHIDVDYPQTGLSPIEFVRTYNSQGSKSRLTNSYWSTTYDRFVVLPVNGGPARLRRPDGRTIRFAPVAGGFAAQPHFRGVLTQTSTGWRYVDEDKTVELFDAQGKLLSITDLDGRVTTATYTKGVLTSVASNAGGSLKFAYDATGSLKTMTDHTNRVWTYTFDGYSDLLKAAQPDASYFEYRYEDANSPYNLTKALKRDTAGNGAVMAGWEYDASGRGIASWGARSTDRRFDIAYPSSTARVVMDPKGQSTETNLVNANGRGFVGEVRGPGYATCGFGDFGHSFDVAMNITSKSTFGYRTEFGDHDGARQFGYRIDAAGTPAERRTDYQYDARFINRPTRVTAPSVVAGRTRVMEIAYNAQGRPTRVHESGFRPDGTAVSRTTELQYAGPFGQISRIDGPRTDVADITTFAYDTTTSRLKSVTDANGLMLRSNITYTPTGQVKSESRPNGVTVTYTYSASTDLLQSMTEQGGGVTRTTRWTYTARREVESISWSDGTNAEQTVGFSYDSAGQLTRIGSTDNSAIVFTRNAAGNIELETSELNNVRRRWLERTFDAYDRVDGSIGANTFSDFDYQPDGTLSKSTDGRMQVTDYTYDDFRRLTRVLQPGAVETRLEHDVADRITRVTDPNQGETRYDFDDLGNQVRVQSPDAGTTVFTFDAAGNVLSTTDAKAQLTSFIHDATGRVKTIDRAGAEYDEIYIYDNCLNGAGRVCRISNGVSEQVDFEYDALGRTTKLTNNGIALGYAYDAAGHVTRIVYPSGRVVRYTYNVAGQVTAVDLEVQGQATALASNVKHEPYGPVTSWTYGNGLLHTRTYDEQYAPRTVSTANTSTVSLEQFDGNGNPTSVRVDGVAHQYAYDALNRLESATGPFGQRSYDYDGVGNRTMLTSDGAVTNYGYAANSNRLESETGWIYQRDANGNTLEKRSTDGQGRGQGYTYSAHDRLTSVFDLQSPLVPLASYRYNGLAQRSQKVADGKTTRFVYGFSPLLLAELENGAVTQEYVYLDGLPLALLGPPSAPSGPAPSYDQVRDNEPRTGDWVLASDQKAVNGSLLVVDPSVHTTPDYNYWHWVGIPSGHYDVYVWWMRPNNAGTGSTLYSLDTGPDLAVSNAGKSKGSWVKIGSHFVHRGNFLLSVREDRRQMDVKVYADAARIVLTQPASSSSDYRYIHADHLGTPLALTDKDKRVVWRASHDPFGATTVTSDPDNDGQHATLNLRFAGQYFDAESGLHYNYFRNYDPSTGRYLESDPIGLEAGTNTFAYVSGNPLAATDPHGLNPAWTIVSNVQNAVPRPPTKCEMIAMGHSAANLTPYLGAAKAIYEEPYRFATYINPSLGTAKVLARFVAGHEDARVAAMVVSKYTTLTMMETEFWHNARLGTKVFAAGGALIGAAIEREKLQVALAKCEAQSRKCQ